MLSNKKILIAVTGGIAAYKVLELVRLLRKHGAVVRMCLSVSAAQFITPVSCQAISGLPVHQDLFDDSVDDGMRHIELAKWADLLLIAPATADCMARLAHGLANDLLGNIYLAYAGPTAVAPAMNQQMWQHDATQRNVTQLHERGLHVWGPGHGEQACGDHGLGRMLEPDTLLEHIMRLFTPKLLSGRRVMVTAGPTQEPIDPVRYISNHSSGRMGYALAEAAKAMGAQVHLVSGPCALPCPLGVERTMVRTAQEMLVAVQACVSGIDVFVSAAAIADYAPNHVATQKIKKHQQTLSIDCTKTPDCLAHVSQLDHGPLTVGFAAETDNLLQHAKQKMAKKRCDMIIANLVGPGKAMCQANNEVVLLKANGDAMPFPLQDKLDLAYALWLHVAKSLAVAV